MEGPGCNRLLGSQDEDLMFEKGRATCWVEAGEDGLSLETIIVLSGS